jgi:enoyl-CoA hydratase/carnithine racemase
VIVKKNGKVTMIGINRPEVRNAVNVATARQLTAEITNFEEDDTAAVGVLYGVGGTFCSGYDLKELAKEKSNANNLIMEPQGAMGPTRRHTKKPLIAAINGFCVAGGLELALMCDLRVMEEDAILGFFNRRFGVPLVDGGTARLGHLIGLSRALDFVLTGRQCAAVEALQIGLANRIVATGTALGQAVNLADSIAKFPQACLNHDRDSLYFAAYEANSFRQSCQNELMTCSSVLLDAAKEGATRFKNGVGRAGKFNDISERDIPDWERAEIEIEKKLKK